MHFGVSGDKWQAGVILDLETTHCTSFYLALKMMKRTGFLSSKATSLDPLETKRVSVNLQWEVLPSPAYGHSGQWPETY
ncbi:hypothetical protein EFP35_14960 [Lactiplantibacillus pentosus]|nr:hypothetical protein [Lactiplantibacillus pentosus]